ncbi:unnamed protein product [Adineta steineri]|uniref:Uncharacterized protein n=1 Tax=Adineta steineri TaxID=433720 RepID=A0A814FXD8_9BILA|nr:unnamed protein product [Adineta steineri]CAF0988804.1 unnamed protein product [Adineta steineri]
MLIVDIGRSLPAETVNQIHYSSKVAPAPMSVSGQQDNYAPPAYSLPVSTVCSQCSALRQDLSAKFCSTCGHSFDRY